MKTITYKLFPFLICVVFLFPILKENISTLSIILLTLNLIVYKITAKDFSLPRLNVLLLTIPFIIVSFYSFFSTNYKISFSHINHSLLFFIIPIVFSLIPKSIFSDENLNLFFKTLKNLCLLIAFIYIISFFVYNPLWKFDIEFHNESSFRNYIYNDFKLFKIHPTYYTCILIFCVTHSLKLVIEKKKYIELIYVISFLSITFLLLTKLTIVLMVILVLYMVLFKNKLNLTSKILVLTLSVGSLFILIEFTPGIKNRFLELYNNFNIKPKELAFDSTNVRKAIFDCSTKIAKENWVFGIGFENLQTELNNCYQSNYNSDFYKDHNYMTHNYYLYILISTGILGFISYLFYLGNIIRISFKSNFFLFKTFTITILILCFIEDFFYRQYGVLYFNLIIMCFINHLEYKKLYKDEFQYN